MFPHSFNSLGLAVHEKCRARRMLESAQPPENLTVIPVSRKAVDDVDFRANRIVDSENPDLPRAFRKQASTSTVSLKSDEHDRVSVVRQAMHQVMKDTSASCHTVGRNNDGRKSVVIDRFGLFDCS